MRQDWKIWYYVLKRYYIMKNDGQPYWFGISPAEIFNYLKYGRWN